ncbi:hypothetical protein [Bacillus sp. AK031]
MLKQGIYEEIEASGRACGNKVSMLAFYQGGEKKKYICLYQLCY